MHGKSKFPLILVKSVFLIKLGAAAVGADSVLAIVYAQDGFAALRQLVVVAFIENGTADVTVMLWAVVAAIVSAVCALQML